MRPERHHPPKIETRTRRSRASHVLARWLGVALLCVLALGHSREGAARVQPYYVLQGASFGQIKPRILFVLDTSGSMSWRATGALAGFWACNWPNCETANDQTGSRIAAARRAMRSVIDSSEAASFALMTFEQPRPPSAVPPRCPGAPAARFSWITDYHSYPLSLGNNASTAINAHPGFSGSWRLCEGNVKRPYPYLRWDELGVGATVVGQHEVGAVPASPMMSAVAGDYANASNATRRVQWFPRFMGVRAHLENNAEDNEVLYETVGDYGATPAAVESAVRGHDFYYWPYVDGFPGYGHWSVQPYNWADPYESSAGVSSMNFNDVNEAQLFAPFYLDLEDVPEVPVDARGPASPDDSREQVRGVTAPMTEGGVDASGSTPWASAIGSVPGIPTYDNRPFSHSTVASYLRFVTSAAAGDRCAPTSAVILTDGEPYPSWSEGGSLLYERLSALRNELGVKTYIVGFFVGANEINQMACAANGACGGGGGGCWAPCNNISPNNWDTCSDPTDHGNECAYLANSVDELETAFGDIIEGAIDLDLPSGPGSAVNDFGVGSNGEPGEGQTLQTSFRSFTEWPGWRGHVSRQACNDRYPPGDPDAGELMPHCVPPVPEFAAEETQPTFGPCPQSRTWDAGECLRDTPWTDRRVYTNIYDPTPGGATPHHRVVRINEDDGTATAELVSVLSARGLLDVGDPQAQADEIVRFALGADAPDDWKLPGLASSAPIVVRRIPRYRADRVPEVSIRDPHCGGRLLGPLEAGAVPESLRDFAQQAWDEDELITGGAGDHYEYQEAVIVGDDMGMLHAFGLDSGNELFGFVPQFALENLAAQAAIGPVSMGQPEELEEHIYGLSATLNQGWVLDTTDATDNRWRHLGVMGMGAGGTEYAALDLSHMSPESAREPLEVLWTSEDPDLVADYSQYNGETWARPALGYYVPDDQITSDPQAFLVLGGGYRETVPDGAPEPPPEQGRTLMRVDALTGEILDTAVMPDISHPVYDDDFGAVVDPSVSSHCISKFWAEMQEVFVTDPAGRLFRWDQGRDTAHVADSGGVWGTEAQPVFTFRACEGAGDTCTVDGSNPGDAFVFAPAVTANDRIDDPSAASTAEPPQGIDQFLLALVSGSPYEDTLDHTLEGNEFHSSLYLLVDDHSGGDPGEGFSIPADGGKVDPGAAAGYMRIALSDIERTREVVPFEGGPVLSDTRNFSRAARPVRAPRVFITGLRRDADGNPATTGDVEAVDDVEVYYISFTVYEPGSGECNEDFYDAATDTWHFDEGSTYEITFRLTADTVSGFDFITGSGSSDVGFQAGLVLDDPGDPRVGVRQLTDRTPCEDGNCGPAPGAPAALPCDNNTTPEPVAGSFSLIASHNELAGFTPVE